MNADGHIISVVIPTLGRQSLALAREAVKRQTRSPDEVIEVLDEGRLGPAWARNEGIRRARGDLVAFTDDDCIVPPDWIERLVGALERHGAAIAGGIYRETDDLLQRKLLRRNYPGIEMEDREGLVSTGGNILIRRAWLDTCLAQDGFVFNESIRIGEDVEFFLRLRRRGAAFIFVPNPVTHLRRVTPAGYFKFQFLRGRGIAGLYEAHHRAGEPPVTAQESLLWGGGGDGRQAADWAAALWRKGIGPFDVSGFTGPRQFAVFWLGEKFEGAGFLWERMKRAATGKKR